MAGKKKAGFLTRSGAVRAVCGSFYFLEVVSMLFKSLEDLCKVLLAAALAHLKRLMWSLSCDTEGW